MCIDGKNEKVYNYDRGPKCFVSAFLVSTLATFVKANVLSSGNFAKAAFCKKKNYYRCK